MFYLITNVFPYSGFFALHLLNGKSATFGGEDGDAPDRDGNHPQKMLYVAANIGPYAGLLASSFRLGRVPTAIPWGRCADVYGRKFALVVGIVAMVVGNLLFGLAPSFATAVGIRFCTGLMNGTMVVARTAISEIAEGDPELESMGVAMMSSMVGYGMLIGPAIGGLLSDPVKQYPGYFESSMDDDNVLRSMGKKILKEHPFLLPNLIGSALSFLTLVIVLLYVEETLPDDQRRDWLMIPQDIQSWIRSRTILRWQPEKDSTRNISGDKDGSPETQAPSLGTISISEGTPLIQDRSTAETNSPARIATVLTALNTNCDSSTIQASNDERTTRGVFASFLNDTSNLRYFFFSMWSYAFTSLASLETFPLFAIASTARGGFGFDETSIGLVQTISGCIFVLGQYACFTFAKKRFGLMKTLRISALGRSLLLLLFPMALYISPKPNGGIKCRSATNCDHAISSNRNWYQLGFLGSVTGVIGILGSIYMGCTTIGVNACIKDTSQRASMNGLHSSIASIGRGLGPLFSGYLVAATMTSGLISTRFNAWVVYGVLMVMEGITYLSARMIPEESQDESDDDSSSRNTNNDDEEDKPY
eukprot:CAMPEP_0197179032 /NCGR_PEP_ID=MMETSP1423-20130617/4105_1 /TAXON_ID=476441 /ORGANISM="Pseudo-nitzschia heimii, Strain UNC1101" /LENGTH=590 /DNA_ID=CAMNT_0042628877 /DNA_START=203 /DNA_END=1975 /DNA_ORIENTATION=-